MSDDPARLLDLDEWHARAAALDGDGRGFTVVALAGHDLSIHTALRGINALIEAGRAEPHPDRHGAYRLT